MTQWWKKKSKILIYLETLGDTPDEIAESLRAAGIKGVPGDGYCCPIVVGIYENMNTWPGLLFNVVNGKPKEGEEPNFRGGLTFNDSQIMDPPSTPAAVEFATRFDWGEYPDLVDHELKQMPSYERGSWVRMVASRRRRREAIPA